jgi:predicted SAM-dependent methyltransferase
MRDIDIRRLPRKLFGKLTRDWFCHWSRKRWRRRFAGLLSGHGLEIGALVAPMPVLPGVKVRYVDRLPAEALEAEYPTLTEEHVIGAVDVVDDAATLATIPDASEDFLIAAHVFEHMTNPVQALEAWCRVVRPGGLVYLAIPHKVRTFDWRRQRTTLEHLVLDYERPSVERDFEHYVDYAKLVHLAQNPKDAIEEADRLLARDFSIHYHVFAPADLPPLLAWFSERVRPVTIVKRHAPWLSDEFHVLLRTH